MLGFSFEHYWGEPPRFVILGREGTEISLCSSGRRGLARPNRLADGDAPWDAYISVSDAGELWDELKLRGARIVRGQRQPLTKCGNSKVSLATEKEEAT